MGFERHDHGGSTVGSSTRSGGDGARASASGVGKRTLVQAHEPGPVQRKGAETKGAETKGAETKGAETEGLETEINASIVPGSEFTGRGRETPKPEEILSRACSDMISVVAAELRGSIESVTRLEATPRFAITLVRQGNGQQQTAFQVRISAEPLRYSEVARSQVNTDQCKHTVQLSNRIADDKIARALIHELTEIIAETRAAAAHEVPAHDDALRPGPLLKGARLSFHDQGRLAELRFLAHQFHQAKPDDVAHLRSEIAALIEHLGLRLDTPGIVDRVALVSPLLDDETREVLQELAQPVSRLQPQDQKALASVAETARTRDAGPLAAEAERRTPLRPPPSREHGRIDPETARKLADEARAKRSLKSNETYMWLRPYSDALQRGQIRPLTCPVQLGAGGATAGLTPDTLFIDNSGRWQRDAADELAQTAGQLSAVRRTDLGDPFQFASANERVPLAAIRYWQDTAAAHARVLDATADVSLQSDLVLLNIKPQEGAPPLRVAMQGTPTIATGFPVERVPGASMPPARAVATVRAGLAKLGTPHALQVHGAIRGLGGNDDAEVIGVARALSGHEDVRLALHRCGGDLPAALDTVLRYAEWGAKRARTPGRVVRGDEANLDAFDPKASNSWLIAGTGGTAISAAENILKKNDQATVHMVGRNAPAGLETNTQWQSIVSRYKERFSYEFRPEGIGAVESQRGENPRDDRYKLAGKTAGGYVAAMGREGALPAPIARMAQQQMARDPASVYGSLLWGADEGQYLGYRITVSGRDFDVTGAASRFPPRDLFTDNEIARANAERDATDESGGFGGGFNATVHQTHELTQHRRTDTVRVVRSEKIPTPPNTGPEQSQARL